MPILPLGKKLEEIRDAALSVMEMEFSDLNGKFKSPHYLPMARRMVCGAVKDLSPDLSYPDIAEITGSRNHTTAMERVKYYYRDIPPALRSLWIHAVILELSGRKDDQAADAQLGREIRHLVNGEAH